MLPQWFPQSAFDRIVNKSDEHFFAGNAIKFRMILEKMKTEIPIDSFFILSDADVLVFDPDRFHTLCTSYNSSTSASASTSTSTYDLVAMIDNLENMSYLNIGLLLAKNTPKMYDFFQSIAETIESTGGQDQRILNEKIVHSGLNYTTFSLFDVIQSNMKDEYRKNTFCIMQLLCTNQDYERNVFEKLLSALNFFDICPVLQFVPHNVRVGLVDYCLENYPTNPVASYEL